MHSLLNLASLLLGLTAWVLPAAALIIRKRHLPMALFGSGACILSLLCQILYAQHLVTIRDWSAIEDTHGAVTFAAAVLAGITLLLNLICIRKARR